MKVIVLYSILIVLISSCASVQEYQCIVDNPENGFYEGAEEGRRLMMIKDTTRVHFVADSISVTMDDIESIFLQDHPYLSKDRYYLTFQFTKEGGEKLSKLTGANFNKHIYLVLGGKIISANLVMAQLERYFCTFISVRHFDKLFKQVE